MSRTLSVTEHRTLLHDALAAILDTDALTMPAAMMYTPSAHRPALYADSSVVRGGTGEGKTFWARALTDPRTRAIAAREYRMPRLERTEAVVGYGVRPDTAQPTAGELRAFAEWGVDPTVLWSAVALTALGVPDLVGRATWTERVDWLIRNPGATARSLAELEAAARTDDTTRLVLFDALDQLHPDRERAEHLASGMLNLAVTLSRQTTRLRAKVFIRPDMLDGALSSVPRADRSTLTSRSADLSWSRGDYLGRLERSDLYGLFFQMLGNRDSAEATAFREDWPTWERTEDGRFLAPAELRHDPAVQERAFTTLAGRFMGGNARKGHTYTYLSCHLQDARGTVTPRPFLAALASALLHTTGSHPEHDRALHHDGLRHGARCGARAEELDRAMPWVRLALEPLAGKQLPIEEDDVLALWGKSGLTARLQESAREAENENRAVRTGPRGTGTHPKLVEELISAGVMSRRTGGQLDMPDTYRVAHRMGSRGGVGRVTPAV